MRFKKIIMVLVLGLLFATSAWAQPSNWAVLVPTHAHYNGTAQADFYSSSIFFCSSWDRTGINQCTNWFCSGIGYLDSTTCFDSYTLVGDYYDCNGTLLQSDAQIGSPGYYNVVQGTGDIFSGGIGKAGILYVI